MAFFLIVKHCSHFIKTIIQKVILSICIEQWCLGQKKSNCVKNNSMKHFKKYTCLRDCVLQTLSFFINTKNKACLNLCSTIKLPVCPLAWPISWLAFVRKSTNSWVKLYDIGICLKILWQITIIGKESEIILANFLILIEAGQWVHGVHYTIHFSVYLKIFMLKRFSEEVYKCSTHFSIFIITTVLNKEFSDGLLDFG